MTAGIYAWVNENAIQLGITLALAVTYFALDRFSAPRITVEAQQSQLKAETATKAVRVARLITGVFGVLILVIVWGIDLSPLLIFATTIITLLGVALFASWSMLSNITAYFVLLLHPSFGRGVFIRIIDGDNYVEGYISELNVFSTKLVTENRSVIVYPNNLLLGRPAMINPGDRLEDVGKLPAARDKSSSEVTSYRNRSRPRQR